MSTVANTSRTQEHEEVAQSDSSRCFGLRARAFLVGIPAVVAISVMSVYGDLVTKTVQFGVLQLAPPAIVGLLLLVLLNKGCSRIARRELLNAADILIVYTMMLVGVMVSTRGAMEKVIPALAFLPYHSNASMRYNDLVTRYLPKWLLPFTPTAQTACPTGLREYYEGLARGSHIPWTAWAGPLVAMFVLVGFVAWAYVCLSALIRRQWMDNERLSFPLTALPVAIIRDELDGKPFLRNAVMWAGFAVPGLVFLFNGLNANIPAVPGVTLIYSINSMVSTYPWNQIVNTLLCVSFAAIGFAYLLPNDLLFSLWFFFILTRIEDITLAAFGTPVQRMGSHDASIFTGHQAMAAYIVLIVSYVVLGKSHYSAVFRTAFTKTKVLDDSGEMLSYRSAIIGLLAAFAGVVVWLSIAGMSPWLATSVMGIYIFFVSVIMSRAVNEAGLLITETSFLPTQMIQLVVPMSSWGPQNITFTGFVNTVFARELRGVLLSPLMDSQKMASDIRMKQRSLLLPFVAAGVVAFAVSAVAFLYLSYTRGQLLLYDYPDGNAGNMYWHAAAAIVGMAPPLDHIAYIGFGIGTVFTGMLLRLRTLLPWFPLNPLAYAVAPTWAMNCLWFPCLVAWIIKVPVMRYGGVAMFQRLRPFMLGMILGEFTIAMLWALLSAPAIGLSAPVFPWP
ncbi:MAG TPA: DUF6785 family protein [Capsulimonadaceae bacterium]|jgi:hypothetical protein